MSQDKKWEIVVMPGAFDNFEGTQEELDELMADIERQVEDGSFFEGAQELDIERLLDEDLVAGIQLAIQMGVVDDLIDSDGNIIDSEFNARLTDEERDTVREAVTSMTSNNRKLN